MTNRFKQFFRMVGRNLFPHGLTAGTSMCGKRKTSNTADRQGSRAGEYCYNEPISTTSPQPLPEISVKGKPAPKHIPGVLESSLPPYPVVWVYFLAKKYPDTEAQKFYDRFQMVSWKSFGVKPIENWQQLADQWMHNLRSHKPPTPNESPSITHKDK